MRSGQKINDVALAGAMEFFKLPRKRGETP
jgi:hypothetical protein